MDESTLFLRVIAHYAKAFWFMIIAGLFFYNAGVFRSWGAESIANCQRFNTTVTYSFELIECAAPLWTTLGSFAMWAVSIFFITKAVNVARLAHEGLRVIEEVE